MRGEINEITTRDTVFPSAGHGVRDNFCGNNRGPIVKHREDESKEARKKMQIERIVDTQSVGVRPVWLEAASVKIDQINQLVDQVL